MKKVLNVLRIIFSVILSFSLMLAIIGTTIIFFANKILTKSYVFAKFEELNIYDQVLEETKDELKNYIYQSGIDETILDTVCTKEKVKLDIITIVNSLYTGENVKIDTVQIEESLNTEIDKILKNQNRKLSIEEEKNIEAFKVSIVDAYKEAIEFYQEQDDIIKEYLPKINKNLTNYQKIATYATAVIIILIITINLKYFSSSINYICISSFSAGGVLILASQLVNSKIDINNLLILTNALSNVIVAFITDFLNSLTTVGKWAMLVGTIGILLVSISKMNKK